MSAPSLELRATGRRRRRAERAQPELGPYQSLRGVVRIPVWDRVANVYRVAQIDVEDYRLAMLRRWKLDRSGYPCVHVYDLGNEASVCLYLHRLVARASKGVQVDHVRHDLLDCRRRSLRLASPSQNSANTRRLYLEGRKSSQYRGVTKHKATGRWQASIKHQSRSIYLGLFDEEVDAALAYNVAARVLFGPFACLNTLPRREGRAA